MRVSTANRYESSIQALQSRQRELTDAQIQMTSGKRVNKPSDDPAAAARAERAFIAQQRIASEQRSVDASRNAMTLAESAVGQVNNVLQSAREAVVASGNGSYSPGERAAKAAELQQYRDQLMSLANQANGAGGFLFGGQGATAMPFLDTPTGVTAAATGGQTQLSSTEQMPTTVDGEAIWLGVPSGNGVFESSATSSNTGSGWIDAGSVTDPSAVTGANYQIVFAGSGAGSRYSVLKDGLPTAQANLSYVAGAVLTVDGMSAHIKGAPANGDSFSLAPSSPSGNAFKALDAVIAVLKNPTANTGIIGQAVNSGLRDVDAVMSRMQAAQAEAGSVLNRLDTIDNRNQDRTLWAKSVQSAAEDLDMVQAISDFKNQETGYQAALQSYASVQRMSLFDYIK